MYRLFVLLVLSVLLTGCQSSSLQLFKRQGFLPTDEGWELGLSSKILFDSDTADIKAENRAQIEKIGQMLQQMKPLALRVDGHCDATGSDAYNEQLSLRRAQAVADILIEAGLRKDLLQVRGLGKRLPVLDNKTRQGRAENRRVAIVVLVH